MTTTKAKATRIRTLIIVGITTTIAAIFLFLHFKNDIIVIQESVKFEHKDNKIFVPETSPLRSQLGVSKVNVRMLSTEITAPATVEAKPTMRANIFAPANGRIVKVFVNSGQTVRAGQALFEFFSPYIAEVQTEYINARSAVAQAEREYKRKEDLQKKGIAALRELEEAQTAFQIAQSEMQGILLKLKIFGIEEENTGKPLIVRSPINGRVVDMNIAPGEFISESETPLMIIADLKKVWVTANIQEKDLRHVQPNATINATFTAYPNENYKGKVLFVSDILNTETRTTRVITEFDNEQLKLKPGMFATVKILSDASDQIMIDQKAILQRRDYNYVYVQSTPFSFEKRKVLTGASIDNEIVIVAGLEKNEVFVSKNAVMLP